ncbi:MAG: hypothetical protein Q7R50_07485 [Dehalococcoidales bacterium]|nr:hypothetical protein [Dehalococcoidales bacterium]
MNNASILAASLVLLVFGIILLRQSKRDKTIPNRALIGILLVVLGVGGVVYQVINFVLFLLYP